MHGIVLLIRAEISRLRRNRRYMITTIGFPIVLYLLIAKNAKGSAYGVPFADYYMVAMATLGAFSGALTGNAIRIASERKDGWIRQLRLTPLPANGYVIAKLVTAMALTVPSIVLVLLLGRFYGGVHLAAWQWITIAVVIWFGSMIFAALAIALGYRLQPDQVQPIALLIYFVFLILGGILFPLSGALNDIGQYTPTYEAMRIATAVIAPSITVSAGLVVGLIIWMGIFTGLAVLSVRATAETV